MITMETRIAYAEVLEILKCMEPQYVSKISDKVMDVFEKEKLKDYKVVIKPNRILRKQNISQKALSILALLNLMYWCEGEERSDVLRLHAINEKIRRDGSV